MQNEVGSTSISYSKPPSYLQPYVANQYHSSYDTTIGCPPVGYTAVPKLQNRSSHKVLPFEQPHPVDCEITPSPSDSCASDASKEALVRSIDFKGFTATSHHTSVPPTPSDSTESSDHESPCTATKEDPDVLLVRIPCKQPVSFITEPDVSKQESTTDTPAHRIRITVNLLDKELWKMFRSVGNEMIVTVAIN